MLDFKYILHFLDLIEHRFHPNLLSQRWDFFQEEKYYFVISRPIYWIFFQVFNTVGVHFIELEALHSFKIALIIQFIVLVHFNWFQCIQIQCKHTIRFDSIPYANARKVDFYMKKSKKLKKKSNFWHKFQIFGLNYKIMKIRAKKISLK